MNDDSISSLPARSFSSDPGHKRTLSTYVGPVSLAIAGTGFLLTSYLISQGLLMGQGAHVLLSGFQGATVGGLADWYAVSALFRRLGPHSDILRRRRYKIEEKIIDLVMNHWLSRESLRAHAQQLPFSNFLIEWVGQPGHPAQVAQLVRQGLDRMLPELDNPEVVSAFEGMLRERLLEMDLGRQLGPWLKDALEKRDHQELWDDALMALGREARSAETQRLIAKLLRQGLTGYLPTILAQLDRPELEAYLRNRLEQQLLSFDLAQALGSWILFVVKGGGHQSVLDALLAQFEEIYQPSLELRQSVETIFKKCLITYANKHPVQGFLSGLMATTIDRQDLEKAFKTALTGWVESVRQDENHALRKEFDNFLRQFASRLQAGEPATTTAVNSLKERVVHSADWNPLIRQSLSWVKQTVETEATSDTPGLRLLDYEALAKTASDLLGQLVDEARSNHDHTIRTKLDGVLKEFADKLAQGDPKASGVVERLKARFVEAADLRGLLTSALAEAKVELARQLANPQSQVMQTVERALNGFIVELRNNPEKREALDKWLREACVGFVENNHVMVGEVVHSNLRRLDDEQFVQLVRDNSWQDLQFIRLNGAVVGFLAGCVLGL